MQKLEKLKTQIKLYRKAIKTIRDMPHYDQDDAIRLRGLAARLLKEIDIKSKAL